MMGFKSGAHKMRAPRMKMPAYADGGLIAGLKERMFGPPETVTQKFARQDAERAAKNPAPVAAPAPAIAPVKELTGYAGMSAMQMREKAAGMKNGGPIRGKGTETSDSIPIMASKNEYMLPADTVKALGGFKTLDKIVAATHKPTGKPQTKMGFKALRDGGRTDNEPKYDALGNVILPGTQAPAAAAPAVAPKVSTVPIDSQAVADRGTAANFMAGIKDANRRAGAAIADVGTLIPRGMAGAYDTAVVRPMRAAGINAGFVSPLLAPEGSDPASQTPFYDKIRAEDAAKAATVSPPAGVAASAPVIPAAPAAANALAAATTQAPPPSQVAPAPANPNEVTAKRQANGVMSFSGGPNIGKDGGDISYAGPAGFKPSGAGVTSVASVGGASSSTDQALSAARFAAAARGDFQAVSDSYNGNFAGGQYSAPGALQTAKQRIQAETRGRPLKAAGAKALIDAQNSDESAANTRALREQSSRQLGIQEQELGFKKSAADRTERQSVQLESVQKTLLDPKSTDVQREQARETLRILGNKDKPDAANRYTPFNKPDIETPTGIVKGGQGILDNSTGQEVNLGKTPKTAALSPGLVVGAATKQPDGTYMAGDKTVTIKSGKVTEIK